MTNFLGTLPPKHAQIVTALKSLHWRQRQWIKAFLEGGCTKRGAKKILRDRLVTPPNDATVTRWQHTLEYVTALNVMKNYYAEMAGVDRDSILIKTGAVLDDALEPKPVLYMGEPTGYEQIDGNVAMRAIEFAGKVNRMIGDDAQSARVTLQIVNIASRDEPEVVATQ